MHETNHLDFTKLLGFDTVADEAPGGLDLQSDTFGDKLGAKVGGGIESSSPAKRIDFQDDTLADKLGAKVGTEAEG